jgi:heme exporter protein D
MLPDLGKYAVPVLSAYGVSIALLLALVWLSLRQAARTREALRQAEARQGREAA